jgi:hypothetical protein
MTAKLTGVFCCECGMETQCGWHDLDIGNIIQCPNCEKVFGCVRPKWGSCVWVEISPKDIEFHRLLDDPEPEEKENAKI